MASLIRPLLLAFAGLAGACSTFSPAPYYDPPYYIDDFGRVFYPEGREPWAAASLEQGYGSVSTGAFHGPYGFAGHASLIDQPLFGFHTRGYYWPPVYRPPYVVGPITLPGSGTPPPAVVTPPSNPSMSVLPPSLPRPVVRYQPEPRNTFRGTDSQRPGNRQVTQPHPRTLRPDRPGSRRGTPRSSNPRPRPKPTPARPREIDPG